MALYKCVYYYYYQKRKTYAMNKKHKAFLHHEVTRTSVQRFVHDTHVQGAQTGFQFFLALSVLQRL